VNYRSILCSAFEEGEMARFEPRLSSKLGFLSILLALLITGCLGAGAPQQPTPLPQGMAFDEASTVYELVPGSSEARFLIGEILRGEPKTVVGRSDQVSGRLAVNLDDPSTAAVGPIQVDARTLVTDNDFRNRALHTRILLTGVYETVTFVPTAVSGLPGAITIGEPVEFQIAGDLTITAYTKPVVFDVMAVAVSEERIEGSATTTIQRADFDLFVPSATGVAGVEEDVTLEIDFVAEAKEPG
jgi:polyisoprenoid-binding protein YceI